MLLGLKTDNPVAELYLYDTTGQCTVHHEWQAGRGLAHGLLKEIDTFLSQQQLAIHDVTGLFVFEGPGSFTGLRIGITVMNTLAYSLSIPIVGSQGDAWQHDAVKQLEHGDNNRVVLPFYGAEARITTPKK